MTAVLIGLGLFLFGFFVFFKNGKPVEEANENNDIQKEEPIGGNTDEQGCLSAAGYKWCVAKEKCLRVFEEFCSDESDALIKAIEEETGVAFGDRQDSEFNWLAGQDQTIANTEITGVLYSIKDVTMADYNKIENYLNAEYGMDRYNVADGVTGGLRGYYIDYMACALSFTHNQMEKYTDRPIAPIGDSLSVDFACGHFNKNDIPKLVASQKIKEILAQKYGKETGEVFVELARFDETHAVGSVVFGQEGSGEGGVFLAVIVDGKWQVVFDGNGSIDCAKMRQEYGFADEILQPGFCD